MDDKQLDNRIKDILMALPAEEASPWVRTRILSRIVQEDRRFLRWELLSNIAVGVSFLALVGSIAAYLNFAPYIQTAPAGMSVVLGTPVQDADRDNGR